MKERRQGQQTFFFLGGLVGQFSKKKKKVMAGRPQQAIHQSTFMNKENLFDL